MRVDDSSIHLEMVQHPTKFAAKKEGSNVDLQGGQFQVTATCTVRGDGGAAAAGAGRVDPRRAPWKLGFMQLRILETQWAYYRGQRDGDGSVLIDHVANQAVGICRDYDPQLGHLWYECTKNPADCYGVPNPALRPPWHLTFLESRE
jgi:hypothetical protein